MKTINELMFEIEQTVSDMIYKQDMQKGEVLALVEQYINVHHPEAIEEYSQDGTNPIYFYGPLETFVKLYKNKLKELL